MLLRDADNFLAELGASWIYDGVFALGDPIIVGEDVGACMAD